jgi:hypothetical protein
METNIPGGAEDKTIPFQYLGYTKASCTGGLGGGGHWAMVYQPMTVPKGAIFDAATIAWTRLLSDSMPSATARTTSMDVNVMTRNVITQLSEHDPYSGSTKFGVKKP